MTALLLKKIPTHLRKTRCHYILRYSLFWGFYATLIGN